VQALLAGYLEELERVLESKYAHVPDCLLVCLVCISLVNGTPDVTGEFLGCVRSTDQLRREPFVGGYRVGRCFLVDVFHGGGYLAVCLLDYLDPEV